MAEFALIQNGFVANVIDAPKDWPQGINITALNPKPGIGWAYVGGTFIAPPAGPAPTPAPTTTTRMTHLGFLDRMKPDEWGRFEGLLSASAEARFAKAKFDIARDVDVSRSDVQTFAYTLRAVGVLLADERVTALLAPIPITSEHALP